MGKGYRDGDAPWRFSGRALYQLNLVKSSEARKHVPADLKLVELFGYTLGGVYLTVNKISEGPVVKESRRMPERDTAVLPRAAPAPAPAVAAE